MNLRVPILLFSVIASGACAWAETGMDPTHKQAWSENAGWADFAPTHGGATVHFSGENGHLDGYAWQENVGWIKLGAEGGGPYANDAATNWGVNLDAAGNLSGYAWSENAGWIRFDPASGGVAIDRATGGFEGHAWGENVGWLKFKGSAPGYGVRTLAFDLQPLGSPNWWLDYHGVQEDYDAGDGVPAWQKYAMDTDPNVAGSYLRILSVSNVSAGMELVIWPSSTRRYYTLSRREDMVDGAWSNVVGQVGRVGNGGEQILSGPHSPRRGFYKVGVALEP